VLEDCNTALINISHVAIILFTMNDGLNLKEQQRRQLLQLVYKLSDGSTRTLIAYQEIADELGWDIEVTHQTCDYLRAERLLGDGSLGATCISHEGIKRIEDNMTGKQPDALAANIVVVNGGQIGNLSQGNNNTVQQSTHNSGPDLAETLRVQMSAVGDLTQDALHLLSLIKASSDDRMATINALDAVCKQNSKWKQIFREFGSPIFTGTASGLLVEACKFLFPH
jgi:hypothetical protein